MTKLYSYGFNGKELDKKGEFGSLNHYDYGFRIYNPGIGRFLSVDPLTQKYPELTPYQFASNTPIWAIDLDGLEATTPPIIQRNNAGIPVLVSPAIDNARVANNPRYQPKVVPLPFKSKTQGTIGPANPVILDPVAHTVGRQMITSAPAVAEELFEVPMLGVYLAKGAYTGDYSDAKYQAAGIFIPMVSRSSLKALMINPKFADQALPVDHHLKQLNYDVVDGKVLIDGKLPDPNAWYSFVIKNDGSLRIGVDQNHIHYSLSDGASSVQAAGKLQFKSDGSLLHVSNNSGHYGTGVNRGRAYTDNVLDAFEGAGLIDEMDRIKYGDQINKAVDYPKDYYYPKN